jgi:hypothetical protein
MSEVSPRNCTLNRAGIRIMAPLIPPEQFCLVFDGIADNYKGVKYRPATVPSRLKYSD